VCAQVVLQKPKARQGKVEKVLDAARKAEARARDRVTKAETAIAAASGEREALVGQRAALDKRVKGLPDAEVLAAQLTEARAARGRADAARQAHSAAVKAERTAGDAVTKVDRQIETARRQCMAQRDPLVSEGLEPPHVEGDLVDSWDGLVAWAAKALPAHEAAKDAGLKLRQISDDEIIELCIYALANEGPHILEEGIALRASDIDMVYLTGYGFPPYRGGPMFYADTVGLDKVLAAIQKFQQGYQGAQWKPAPLLVKLAKEGRRFNG
jgi:hypothetical protein